MHHNPGASIDFSKGLIKDVGRDGGGVYRNISRDLRIPDFLTNGNHKALSWAQLCNCLPAQSKEDRIKVLTATLDLLLCVIYLTVVH